MKKTEIIRLINKLKQDSVSEKEVSGEYVRMSYSILTYSLLQKIKSLNGTVLEVGAGNGNNSMLMKLVGIKVYPIDLYPGPNIEKMDHRQGLKKYKPDIVFICWPSYEDSTAYDILKRFNGIFIYVGEPDGGATANDNFFKLLEKDWNCIYKKKLHAFYNLKLPHFGIKGIVNYFGIYIKKN